MFYKQKNQIESQINVLFANGSLCKPHCERQRALTEQSFAGTCCVCYMMVIWQGYGNVSTLHCTWIKLQHQGTYRREVHTSGPCYAGTDCFGRSWIPGRQTVAPWCQAVLVTHISDSEILINHCQRLNVMDSAHHIAVIMWFFFVFGSVWVGCVFDVFFFTRDFNLQLDTGSSISCSGYGRQ